MSVCTLRIEFKSSFPELIPAQALCPSSDLEPLATPKCPALLPVSPSLLRRLPFHLYTCLDRFTLKVYSKATCSELLLVGLGFPVDPVTACDYLYQHHLVSWTTGRPWGMCSSSLYPSWRRCTWLGGGRCQEPSAVPAANTEEPTVHQTLCRHVTSAFLLILGGHYLLFTPEESGTQQRNLPRSQEK